MNKTQKIPFLAAWLKPAAKKVLSALATVSYRKRHHDRKIENRFQLLGSRLKPDCNGCPINTFIVDE